MAFRRRTRVSVNEHAIEDFGEYWSQLPYPMAEAIIDLLGENYRKLLRIADDENSLKQTRARRILSWLVLREDDPKIRFDQVTTSDWDLVIINLAPCSNCGKDTPCSRREKPKPKVEVNNEQGADDLEPEDVEPDLGDIEFVCLNCGRVHPADADDEAPSGSDPTQALPGTETSESADRNGQPSSPTSSASGRGNGTSSRSTKASVS